MNSLTPEELHRYSRHLTLRDFGLEGQLKLKHASVLVVGAGGLGCSSLLYLTAAGVGRIGIVDVDKVSLSNLQRQVVYSVDDVGLNKAEAAKEKLLALNPNLLIEAHPVKITSGNASELLMPYSIILDCSDNFPTRYLLNDACVLLNKPLIYGSVLQYEGHVAVFNHVIDGKRTANYRDLFPSPPPPDAVPNCEEAGVLGVLPGMIGCMQANEAIKLMIGRPEVLANKLLVLDSQTMECATIRIQDTGSRATVQKLLDYEDFCGMNEKKTKSLGMKEITVQELFKLKQAGADFQLIDVREAWEYDMCNLAGESIPLSEIPSQVDRISRTKQVIIHCKSGGRSSQAVKWLEKNHGMENLYSLKGGITEWINSIDPSMSL